MIRIIRAKLHGVRVTESDLNYHGSITLDPEWCRLIGLYPLEFVDIWNKTNGARFATYIILGAAGSRVCCLNGATARLCHVGDEMIIAASQYVQPDEVFNLTPRVATFDENNAVTHVFKYKSQRRSDGLIDFQTLDITNDI